jgi:hypothetical protein
MKATLIKRENHYDLFEGTRFISTTECEDGTVNKLSKQNCDEIFGIYSPSELSKVLTEGERGAFEFGYCLAREHNSHKVFTLEDVKNAMDWIMTQYFEFHEQPTTGRREHYLKSLQKPTEIEVEIEMECLDPNCDGIDKKGVCIPGDKPKLDSKGCLILKKI